MEAIRAKKTIVKQQLRKRLGGFTEFISEQGVVGLAIGFVFGGAVSKIVTSFVDNIINPLVGLMLGKVDLADKVLIISGSHVKYGAFVSSLVDFIILAAVVYIAFKRLGLDRLSKKKD